MIIKETTKFILLFFIALFGAGTLFTLPANAVNSDLVVEWSTDGSTWQPLSGPIFSETDFKPGDSVSRWIRVSNNSSKFQNIAIEAISWPGFPNPEKIPDRDLSRALSIIIKGKDGNDLYGGTTEEKTLYNFYRKDDFNATYEHILTYDLPGNGASTTYEFLITFPSEKGNKWQGATTTFDILIGFQRKEGSGGGTGKEISGTVGAGGTGGGTVGAVLPRGLTILDESVRITTTTERSVTIIWTTSYFSTSQVIYDTVPGKFNLTAGPPNYGYTFSKEGDDSQKPKVTSHSVTITGLNSGITYYYRCVSHGSPVTISRERSFTTLGTKEGVGKKEERQEEKLAEKPVEEIGISGRVKEIPKRITEKIKKVAERITPSAPIAEAEKPSVPKKVGLPEKETVPAGGEAPQRGLASMFASLGMAWQGISQSVLLSALLIICLLLLALLFLREYKLFRKKWKK